MLILIFSLKIIFFFSVVADFFEQIQFSDFARQILFSNNCDNIINNPLIIQQQQQSAITNIPNYNLNQNSLASLTNNHHQKQQQQPPNSSTISPQTQSLLVAATPQTSLNGMLLGGNTRNTPATAVNNNTPMNVLNGLSNYFANGIQQQQQQSLQQTQQQQPQTSLPLQHQPQTVFPLPQLQQQIIEQTQKQSFQQHQRQQQQMTTNNFVQMQQQQQLYFPQQQQNTPIQFINNSFPPTSLNPSTLQQQQNFRQIQLQQQLQQQQHFNQPTIVPYPTQQHPQPSPHQQQQQQPNTPQLSQPTSLRQPTPHSQTNPVRTPQNSVVSPGRPISRHPTPQQLAGTNWQQAQLVQNQNNNVPPQTQFDQAYIYQTKLFDASPLQKVFQPTSSCK